MTDYVTISDIVDMALTPTARKMLVRKHINVKKLQLALKKCPTTKVRIDTYDEFQELYPKLIKELSQYTKPDEYQLIKDNKKWILLAVTNVFSQIV